MATTPATCADVAAAKSRPISKKIRLAIRELVDGASITAAAEKVGLRREHLSRELRRTHIAALLHDKVVAHLAINAAKAGHTKVSLLDSPNEMVRDRASSFILGLAGIAPVAQPVNPAQYATTPGVVIQIVQGEPTPPKIDVTPIISP